MPKKERTTRTPAERATAEAEVADRLVARIQKRVDKAEADLREAEADYDAAVLRRNAYKNLADELNAGAPGAEPTPAAPATAEEAEK